MKLLHVVPSYAPAWRYGGPIQSVAALCQGLASLGEDVTVFTTNIDGPRDLPVPLGQPVLRDAVKVHYFQVQSPRRWSFSWPLTRALEQSTREFDLVHLHGIFGYPQLAAGFFCRRSKTPYVLSPRGMLCRVAYGMKPFRKRVYRQLLERHNLEGACAIHFTTSEEKRQSMPLSRPSVIVPNGLSIEEFAELPPYGTFRAQHPEISGKRLILFLGRLHPIKGLDRLVQAFSRLKPEYWDAHLVIAGYDSEGYGLRVRQWLRQLGLLEKVTFTGPLLGRNKLAALRDCDLFVMPSYQENFGMAALEAMACGAPVILSKGVYLCSEVQKARAGLVTEGEPAGFVEAIETLIRDASLRAQMGDAGRCLVREQFSAERAAEQMRSVYRTILSNPKQLSAASSY